MHILAQSSIQQVVGEPGGSGEVAWRLQYAWNWAPWLTVLAIAVCIGWICYIYSKESGARRLSRAVLATLRILVILILLCMLAQPVFVRQRMALPNLAIILDRSASMDVLDVPVGKTPELPAESASQPAEVETRLDFAKQALTADDGRLLDELAKKYQLQVYLADDQIESVELDDIADVQSADISQSSRIGSGLQEVLRDLPRGSAAGIVLLSDGVNNAGISLEAAAKIARQKAIPVYTVGLGSSAPPRDLQIADVLVDEAVFLNDLVNFQATVKSSGLSGGIARVVLRQGDSPEVLAEQIIRIPSDDVSIPIGLVHRPTEAGTIDYVIEVESNAEERDTKNNRQQRTVEVRDEKIRVLFAQAYPNYEFRYLKNLLQRDPGIELSTYLQDSDSEYAAQDASAIRNFPLSRQSLSEYDVVILGDVNLQLLPRSVWPHLLEVVEEQGGGLIFIAGPRHLPWQYVGNPQVELLMPIDASSAVEPSSSEQMDFAPQPTELGLRNAALQLGDTLASTREIWRSLPPLHWLALVGSVKPGAQVLAEHPTRTGSDGQKLPVVCLQYVGKGRVLFHAVDSTWRWRYRVGDRYFARYWLQTLRFLARSKLLNQEESTLIVDKQEYELGEQVTVRLKLGDADQQRTSNGRPTLIIQPEDGTQRKFVLSADAASPNTFSGSFSANQVGSFTVRLADSAVDTGNVSARFNVTSLPGELANTQMDRAALSAVAETTHGGFFTAADVGELWEQLPEGRPTPLETVPAVSLWNSPWLIGVLMGLLVTEWIWRRRLGLL